MDRLTSRRLTGACLAALALLAAGCSARNRHSGPDRVNGEAPRSRAAAAEQVGALPHGFVRGISYAHVHRRGHGYGSSVSASTLARLGRMGVDGLALMPFGYQRRATDERVFGFPGHGGDSGFFSGVDPSLLDHHLLREVRAAHRLGMRVMIKPHVWSNDYWHGQEWHGTIRQRDAAGHARWWRSYRALILHYARLARRAGAEQYCIGTELVQMSTRYPDEWRALAADVRKVYEGQLTYAAHWDRELDQIAFWDALDFIGVNAYFPLDASDAAPVERLVDAWRPHRQRLARLARATGKPVVFTEAGYRPVTGTFRRPWRQRHRRLDPEAQARAFSALFRAFSDQSWWHGIYIWKVYTDPRRGYERGPDSFSFLQLPAEGVIRARWAAK
jgi:hypothetical protein